MDEICHSGFVSRVNSNKLYVNIVSQSACSECHAKGFCNLMDKTEKEIEIEDFKGEYEVGQKVTVVMRESAGFRAVLIGYILPLAVLLIALFTIVLLTGDESTGALISIGMVMVYYAVLFLFRDKLKKNFRFELKET